MQSRTFCRRSAADTQTPAHAAASTLALALTIVAGALLPLANSGAAIAADAPASTISPTVPTALPFDDGTVAALARDLATRPYVPPDDILPSSISDLDYDAFQAIQFKADKSIGRDAQLPIELQLLHRGMIYRDRIAVSLVANGVQQPVVYSPDLFTFGTKSVDASAGDIGFSGIRLLAELAGPAPAAEFAVFQGASYFRAHGLQQGYGLSARGLALKTAQPGSEEFPIFREFWVERPQSGHAEVVVYALLDSPSVAGAYRFTIDPGATTTMEVRATLFPRVDLADVGLAPGTSMFDFDANGRKNVDDYRPEVHDSDGLLIVQNDGEKLWRPLSNPKSFQVTTVPADHPAGFGLLQRARSFDAYQDIWANYENRPSLFVQPEGDWGDGAVTLVEIPTVSEFFDNIVAYWQPAKPIPAGSQFSFSYRLDWGNEPTGNAAVIVAATRRGQALSDRPIPNRQFVITYDDPSPTNDNPVAGTVVTTADAAASTGAVRSDDASADAAGAGFGQIMPSVMVTASAGRVYGLIVAKDPRVSGWQVGFMVDPEGATPIDLQVELTFPDQRSTEVWVYHWTGD